MLLAQALILPADLILLFWEPLAWLGILFFIGVQVCYFLRLRRTLRGYLRPRGNQMEAAFLLCAAAVWFAVIGCAVLLRLTLSAETVLAALYIVLFAFNLGLAIYEAFRFQKESGIWFAAGLLLFFLCDIHVGLCNLSPALPDVGAAAWYTGQVAPLAMWFFYLPGQVLLVGSGAERSDGWNSRRR